MNFSQFNATQFNGLDVIDILLPITDYFWDTIFICATEITIIDPEVTSVTVDAQPPIIVRAEPRGM